ncbi:alpha-D-ribose 1-methylphosphonate 5-phosphate C-P-lyase PhnJ [Oceanobacillus iheyensis]|uniref:alpha-D-ribose 1-methylphosphonate 5-phosphate C-P-lyase PhnJ n=1 Tax=Oceanobacillus iheyensis TaxID=182710 RepID=UPI003637886C
MIHQKTHFAFLDESSKKEIRRATLKAVAIPGYQVPFSSREMPIGRGWGTGGLQLTLSLVGKEDILKVIDQGADESVNAVSIKKLVQSTTNIEVTEKTQDATLIQSRHRIPEIPLTPDQILVLQVPMPEPLRAYESKEAVTKNLHAEQEYSGIWMMLFEQIIKYSRQTTNADHPVMVNNHYIMAPSPIPRFDNPKMNQSEALILLGAGREKKIYAVPPFTPIESLAFNDYPFAKEDFTGKQCKLCGSSDVFLDELVDEKTQETFYQCNDSSYCMEKLNNMNTKEVESIDV